MTVKPVIKLPAPPGAKEPRLAEELKTKLLERFGDSEVRRRTVTLLADGVARAASAVFATSIDSFAMWWSSPDRCAALADVREDFGCVDVRRWLLAKVTAYDDEFSAVWLEPDDVANVRDALRRIEEVERREPMGVAV
jgi:hypothetical protein